MSKAIPKYKCKEIAHDINALIHPTPAMRWQHVQDYYSPPLIGAYDVISEFHPDDRSLVKRALERELRYLHAR